MLLPYGTWRSAYRDGMSTVTAWGHHSILLPSLAAPGWALQQDNVTGILGKPLAPAALMKNLEAGIWWLWKQAGTRQGYLGWSCWSGCQGRAAPQ